MDVEVLPGPSLPELARTALVRAVTATVSGPGQAGGPDLAGQVPVRAGLDGSPLLLPAAGSPLERQLADCPGAVTVTVPASTPFHALRVTGTAQPMPQHPAAGITACLVAPRTVEFTGSRRAPVPVEEYQTAVPDPLWQVAPAVLSHLEHGHLADLVGCVRAHGMTSAEWVVARGLDRYGLELLVLGPDGAAAVRLSFPGGPVTSLQDVPVSVRAVLTCRCHAGPGHSAVRPAVGE
jgi:hypothetical protein